MADIGVKFEILKLKTGEITFKTINATSMKIVLKELNLAEILTPVRAGQVRELWTNFIALYDEIRYNAGTTVGLEERAQSWLKSFTAKQSGEVGETGRIRGMYPQDEVTPYIHVFVDHCPKLRMTHGPLDPFACDGLEKKGHLCQGFFWRKTLKGGGKKKIPPILTYLLKENRDIYFIAKGMKVRDEDDEESDEEYDDDQDDEDEEDELEEDASGTGLGKKRKRKTCRHLVRKRPRQA